MADPTKQLAEFEAKAGVLSESRVTDVPELGTLSIDMTAMQKVFGKEEKRYVSTHLKKLLRTTPKPFSTRKSKRVAAMLP